MYKGVLASVIVVIVLVVVSPARALVMVVDSGDDSWVYNGNPEENKKGPCTLREAVEAWRFARGIPQSGGIVHPNVNACETQNGANGATGQDVILVSSKVKGIVVNTNHPEGSISLSYIPKYKASSALEDAVPVQSLVISTAAGTSLPSALFYNNVTISPMPGMNQTGSLFVMNGGGDQVNPSSNAYNEKLSVTLEGFTFQGAFLTSGGGGIIRAQLTQVAELVLHKCIFRGNQVDSANNGDANGAAVSISGGVFFAQQCMFEHNIAVKGAALDLGVSSGWNGRPATKDAPAFPAQPTGYFVVDCAFLENSASQAGGAIYAHENEKVTIVGSTFEENEAGRDYKESMSDDGGGGAINAKAGLTLLQCSFVNNNAFQKGGGAVYVRASSPGELQFKTIVMRGNTAGMDMGEMCDPAMGNECVGGAIRAESGFTCNRCVLSNNISYGPDGGGALAMKLGGVPNPVVRLINTLVADNRAVLAGMTVAGLVSGGGVAMIGSDDQLLEITGSTIINNEGWGQIDGAIGGKSMLEAHNSVISTSHEKEYNCTGTVNGSPVSVQNLQNNDDGADTCPNMKGETRANIDMQFSGATYAAFPNSVGVISGLTDVNQLGVHSAFPGMFHVYSPGSGPAFGAGDPLYCTDMNFSYEEDLLGAMRATMCTLGAVEKTFADKEKPFFN